eukprot:symbB.v1.2.003807.t1/scaffold192.1/size616647/18
MAKEVEELTRAKEKLICAMEVAEQTGPPMQDSLAARRMDEGDDQESSHRVPVSMVHELDIATREALKQAQELLQSPGLRLAQQGRRGAKEVDDGNSGVSIKEEAWTPVDEEERLKQAFLRIKQLEGTVDLVNAAYGDAFDEFQGLREEYESRWEECQFFELQCSRPGLLIYSVTLVVALGSESNLNGDYVLSATPNAPLTAEKFPTHFSDYPRKPSYFDVYSPTIKTLYSQVFWKSLPPVDIPDDIVKRFDGKGMAVVGFEVDQVRRTDHGDVSVPITVAYNHHFETTMIGKAARFEQQELEGPNDPRAHGSHGHGAPLNWRPGDAHWTVQEPEPVAGAIPSRQDFRGANGGEFRKSFHGYPPGFVQVVASPTQFQITPMQIDTWNREKMNISHPTRFVPGPSWCLFGMPLLERTSLAPTTGPDALYSGLLECPVTTRITKHVQSNAKMHIGGAPCESQVASGDECMEIAKSTLPKHRFASLQTSQEVGCFLAGDINEPDLVHVSFKAPRGREAFALHQELASGAVG